MEKKKNYMKVGISRILWAVLAIVLCAAPSLRADVKIPDDGEEYNIPGDFDPIVSGTLWVYGTVNLLPGADIEWFVYATATSVVNIKGGTVGYWIDVAPTATVTLYGTDLALDTNGNGIRDDEDSPLDYGPQTIDSTVVGFYANEDPINLTFDCQPGATVTLAAPGDTTPPDITCPGDITIEAMGPDGVPVDDDRIQIFLAGTSADDDCDPEPVITNDAPDVFLPGDTIVNFTATDTSGNMSTCSSTVTVIEASEGHLRIIPPIINREGRLTKELAVIRFPEGTTEDDINMDEPLVLFPGDCLYGIEATNQRIVTWCRWGTLRVSIFGSFSKDEVTAAVPEDGPVEFMVVGRFVNGQYFYGTDTVRIVSWDWKWWW